MNLDTTNEQNREKKEMIEIIVAAISTEIKAKNEEQYKDKNNAKI